MIRGPWTDPRVDRTARLRLTGLAPGREYDASVWFASADGTESTREELRFRTAPIHAAAQSVIWSGDTCGQGWGIDRGRGGLTTYRAMLALRPDLFVHVGDTIYGDEPMTESVRADDGSLWVNDLTDEVTTVAETLGRVPRTAPLSAARRQRARLLRRGADRRAVGRPRDLQQLVPGRDDRRRALHRATGRRAGDPGAAGVAGVPAGPGDPAGPVDRRRVRRRPGSTAGCRVASTSTCSASTCAATAARTQPLVVAEPARHPRPRAQEALADRRATPLDRHLEGDLRRPAALGAVDAGARPGRAVQRRRRPAPGPRARDGAGAVGDQAVRRAQRRLGHHRRALHRGPPLHARSGRRTPTSSRSGSSSRDRSPRRRSGPRTTGSTAPSALGSSSRKGEDTDRLDVTPRPDNQYFGHLAIAATGELTVTLYDGAGTALWSRLLEPELTLPGRAAPRR